jgi:pyruvate kinase
MSMTMTDAHSGELQRLIHELEGLRAEMVQLSDQTIADGSTIDAGYRSSCRNLLYYLALRRHDLRALQQRLAILGLSSLGRAESHVLGGIDAVLRILHQALGQVWDLPGDHLAELDLGGGNRLLAKHAKALFGPIQRRGQTRIMVTMSSEAADDYQLVHDLLKQGMNLMRINCAHDNSAAWSRMIAHLQQAKKTLGVSCRILMDLGGPKLRTGPIEPGPAVLRIRPKRDQLGRVTAPARIWLTSHDAPAAADSPADAFLPLPSAWVASLQPGDDITLSDARAAHRRWQVTKVTSGGAWAVARKTAYLTCGTVLIRQSQNPDDKHCADACVGELPRRDGEILLKKGDLLLVTNDLQLGLAATRDSTGGLLTPAHIGCTLPDVFAQVKIGASIWLDDGKIEGRLERVSPDCLHVRIERTRLQGDKLRSDKGINLPDSTLHLPALTARDLIDLEYVVRHADLVGLSFANCVEDVEELMAHLTRLQAKPTAIMLKIETRRGFENLPKMLLKAMRTPGAPGVAVMIARGDLAVECGFDRLAEIQEEILWICEAAHCPVIWATQVLETLAKDGMPSRAEITDAAMGHRAECVMLNKGSHVVEAVTMLKGILKRMEAHQRKKSSLMRELKLARSKLPFYVAST